STPPLPRFAEVQFRDEFKYTGFDVGGYFRAAVDFPITEFFTLQVGSDFKISGSDVMIDPDDARKHWGVIVGLTQQF
ncbi:MAG: hypothetical protein ACRDD1_10175, partial [Planctomycetia bacterium]